MEQQLINELIRLLCKSGGETFVGNFQRMIDEDKKTEAWTQDEITEAVQYIRYINDYFGRDEALAIITALAGRYNIEVGLLSPDEQSKVGAEDTK